jgi:hypothetical protein
MNANTPNFDVDRNIDCALAGLRDAQPRSGLNSRILASLEHRSSQPQRSRLDFSAHLALWTAAILAIASLMILHHEPIAPAQFSKNAVARRATNPEPFSTTNPAQNSNTLSSRPKHRRHAAMRSGETPVFESSKATQSDRTTITNLDVQAVADLHAPSHPAPPLPLTPQEKLFLHMLHYGNATQLAELDPLVRAQQDADETTAFKAFFPDPPPLKQPGDTE